MYCVVSACSWLRTMAEYTVTSLLRSDGSVQTTSRVTLEHLPNFINGNEMQMFIRTHGLAHQQSVQSHGPSRDAQRYAITPEGHVRAPPGPAIPGSSSPQAHRESQMRRRTGVNGKVMGGVLMVIKGGPARLRCLPLKSVHPRTALCCFLSQFDSMYPILAVIASSCALVAGSRKLPS